MENRVLGDIDYHSDNPDNSPIYFDFTVEEVRMRYVDFLRLGGDNQDDGSQGDNGQEEVEQDGQQEQPQPPTQGQPADPPQGQAGAQAQAQAPADADSQAPHCHQTCVTIQQTIDDNLRHEVDELNAESAQSAFTDFNYWKPQVDMNLDEILSEMNKSH